MNALARRALQAPFRVSARAMRRVPGFKLFDETRDTQTPVTVGMWVRQQVFGVNHGPYWPVHPTSRVVGWRNVLAGVETSPGYMPGCYVQALGTIEIGDYTQIGPSVGLISANHEPGDLRRHRIGKITIGRYCWLGMGAMVLPDVTLGDFTVVGAGAVVTRSFPDGYCVIAGNPAAPIRSLDPEACTRHRSRREYHGFIPKARFAAFRAAELAL
ncbi:MAG: acyltransferase [Pseudomonadota bacterium]